MTASGFLFSSPTRRTRASLRSRCWAASEPASDCSLRSNASLTPQDSLPVFMHEATVLGSMPNAAAAAMREGAGVIYQAVLFDGRRLGYEENHSPGLGPASLGTLQSRRYYCPNRTPFCLTSLIFFRLTQFRLGGEGIRNGIPREGEAPRIFGLYRFPHKDLGKKDWPSLSLSP